MHCTLTYQLNGHELALQLLLVLSTYKTSPEWLQHPSNSAHVLCGASSGLGQGQGFLWWPSTANLSDSYCVSSCPQLGTFDIELFCMRKCSAGNLDWKLQCTA